MLTLFFLCLSALFRASVQVYNAHAVLITYSVFFLESQPVIVASGVGKKFAHHFNQPEEEEVGRGFFSHARIIAGTCTSETNGGASSRLFLMRVLKADRRQVPTTHYTGDLAVDFGLAPWAVPPHRWLIYHVFFLLSPK